MFEEYFQIESLVRISELVAAIVAAIGGISWLLLPKSTYSEILTFSPFVARNLLIDVIIIGVFLYSIYVLLSLDIITVKSYMYQAIDMTVKAVVCIPVVVLLITTGGERLDFWKENVIKKYVSYRLNSAVEDAQKDGVRKALHDLEDTSNILEDHPASRRLEPKIAILKKLVVRSNDLLEESGIEATSEWNPVADPMKIFLVSESLRLNPNDPVASQWLSNSLSNLDRKMLPHDKRIVCNGDEGNLYTISTKNSRWIKNFVGVSSEYCSRIIRERWRVSILDSLLQY